MAWLSYYQAHCSISSELWIWHFDNLWFLKLLQLKHVATDRRAAREQLWKHNWGSIVKQTGRMQYCENSFNLTSTNTNSYCELHCITYSKLFWLVWLCRACNYIQWASSYSKIVTSNHVEIARILKHKCHGLFILWMWTV